MHKKTFSLLMCFLFTVNVVIPTMELSVGDDSAFATAWQAQSLVLLYTSAAVMPLKILQHMGGFASSAASNDPVKKNEPMPSSPYGCPPSTTLSSPTLSSLSFAGKSMGMYGAGIVLSDCLEMAGSGGSGSGGDRCAGTLIFMLLSGVFFISLMRSGAAVNFNDVRMNAPMY